MWRNLKLIGQGVLALIPYIIINRTLELLIAIGILVVWFKKDW